MTHQFGRLTNCREIVDAIPLRKQSEILQKAALGVRRQHQTKAGETMVELDFSVHSVAAFGLGRPESAVAPVRSTTSFESFSPGLRYTSKTEIAAGVIPEMRVAWPRVSGRCWFSFCCTSTDSPRT